MVISIVGKIGSGKSVAVKYLQEEYNAICFSCDDIAKEIIEKGQTNYDPGYAGEVFINEKKLEECRTILHPEVFNRINENLNNFKNKMNFSEQLFIIESALPSESMYDMCDKVIYIYSSFENRVKRLKDSRDYSEEKTKLIYDTQKYYEAIYDKADFKIENNGTKEELIEKIKEVIDEVYFTVKQ